MSSSNEFEDPEQIMDAFGLSSFSSRANRPMRINTRFQFYDIKIVFKCELEKDIYLSLCHKRCKEALSLRA